MAGQGAAKIEPGAMRSFKDDFPALQTRMNGKKLVFLDSGASAQKPFAVIEAMDNVMNGGYANIHRGIYRLSQDLTADFEAVRAKIAAFIGAESEKNIVFTRNATESINLVAQSWGRTHLKQGDEVILSLMEHHANIVPWQILQSQIGIEIRVIPLTDEGNLDLEALKGLLSPKTRLVSLVHGSNVLGTINPVKEINALVKSYNPDIHTLFDGSQAVVHSPVHMGEIGCDFYVFTGHKLYGPTGIGVLYGKTGALASMPPWQGGGDMIDRVSFEGTTFREPPYRFEAGTPAIVEVIGLGAAIDYIQEIGWQAITAHESRLKDYAYNRLAAIEGLEIYGHARERAAIFSFNMKGLHATDIGMILDQCGIAVRTGHHCCMPLMAHLGAEASVRASIALYSQENDIDALVEGLEKARTMLS